MRKAYADVPGGQMNYRLGGAGKTVILLHMSGSSSEEYAAMGDLLAARGYRVVIPDLMGFGASDEPTHYYYSMDEHISTLLALMDSLGIEKAVFYGNMATANLSARLAARHPERVEGLFLAHPLYNPDPEYFRRRGRLPGFARIPITEDGSHAKEYWARAAKYGDPAEISERRCADLHKAGEWGETLHWALHEDTPFGEYAGQVKAKTVIAAYSFFGEPVLLRDIASRFENGEFLFLENATPYIARRDPERMAGVFAKAFPAQV